MEIRPLEDPDDIRDVARVNALAWQAAFEGIVPESALEQFDPDRGLDDSETEEAFAALQGDREAFLVAEIEGSVVGYAYVRWGAETKSFVGQDEAGLKELYVDPAHWDRGVGTALLEAGLDRLPSDVERLRLETLADNDVGRRFYEARGFEATGTTDTRIAGESLPAVIYTLEL